MSVCLCPFTAIAMGVMRNKDLKYRKKIDPVKWQLETIEGEPILRPARTGQSELF